MDWLTFIVEMTKALVAWPLATVAIIVLLRESIRQLIPNVRKFRFGDQLQIDFGQELREIGKQAESTLPEPKEITKTVTVPIEAVARAEGKAEAISQSELIDTNEKARRLAELAPTSAIDDAWVELESALRKAASANGIAVSDKGDPLQLMKALLKQGKVGRETYEIFGRLRNVRNWIAQERPTDITAEQALEYRELTRRLATTLLSL